MVRSAMNIDGVSILARGITAVGRAGAVFDNVDLTVDSGSLTVITGAAGSGRTSLLLAIAGRFRLAAGFLEVSGYPLPKDAPVVRDLVLPARLRPGFELEGALRVRDAAMERRAVAGLPARLIDDALNFLSLEPDPYALVSDLPPVEQLLLAIGLTAAEAPEGMLVDDVEEGLPPEDRIRVWNALRALTTTGMTVVASCTDPLPDATVIRLPAKELR